MRLLWLFLILALLVIVPFVLWGDYFGRLFELEATQRWMDEMGTRWAWLAGIGLLLADLFLPIPGTLVISALGFVYGFWLGGLIGMLGSMLAGLLAYGLCRAIGRPAAEWIAGAEDLAKGEALFGGPAGGWMVALSRWLPVMPEVIACLAGLARMPVGRFVPALACGSIPLGFTFAAIGAWGHENPGWALLLSAGLPPILWALVGPAVKRGGSGKT
jgi:uncharacterized membrane protein YdjX (TVP38/TMEM64 family)